MNTRVEYNIKKSYKINLWLKVITFGGLRDKQRKSSSKIKKQQFEFSSFLVFSASCKQKIPINSKCMLINSLKIILLIQIRIDPWRTPFFSTNLITNVLNKEDWNFSTFNKKVRKIFKLAYLIGVLNQRRYKYLVKSLDS